MLVCYFDEVKPNSGFDLYCFGAICVQDIELKRIENELEEYSIEVFGSSRLEKSTEFHAKDIYHGKSAFKGKSIERRLETLDWFINYFEKNLETIMRIDIRVDCEKYNANDPDKTAFMYLCERVNTLSKAHKCNALMIGDLDDAQSRKMIGEFSKYKVSGTDWEYSSDLSNLIDTVHFVRSHHSRFIQLADIFLFLQIHSKSTRQGYIAEELTRMLKGKNFRWPTKYKYWPK